MEGLKREIALFVERVVRDATARINLLVDAGLAKLVKDERGVVELQVEQLDGELDDQVELWQGYGVSFVPPVDSEVLFAAVAGDRGYSVGICAQKRDQRPKGSEAGEGGLYYMGEWKVFLAADGTVALGAKDPSDYAALASLVEAELDKIRNAIAAGVPTPNDGGAALLASILANLSSNPRGDVGSTTVKVES
jgi:phage gp45-like